jgi:hypothetical protein
VHGPLLSFELFSNAGARIGSGSVPIAAEPGVGVVERVEPVDDEARLPF